MPFVLLALGVLFLVIGFRGTQNEFAALVKGDFSGSGNFLYWIVSIMVVGAIGYIPKLKPLSDSFLVLIILVLFLANQGFFTRFTNQTFNRGAPTPIPNRIPTGPGGLQAGPH